MVSSVASMTATMWCIYERHGAVHGSEIRQGEVGELQDARGISGE